MRLETEFRLRLQLMQLEAAWQGASCCDRESVSDRLLPQFPPDTAPEAGLWVRLRHAPGCLSGDEALLLCQLESDQWLAWVPDYGEVVLDLDDFYVMWGEED